MCYYWVYFLHTALDKKMTSHGNEEEQKPQAQAPELKRNTKITAFLVISGLVSITLAVMAWVWSWPDTNNYSIQIGQYVLDIRPYTLWVMRILGLIAGALSIATAFVDPLSRPFIGMGVALPLLAIVPFLFFIATDTCAGLDISDAEGTKFKTDRIFAWMFAIMNSTFLILAALVIASGRKIRFLAPFREESA